MRSRLFSVAVLFLLAAAFATAADAPEQSPTALARLTPVTDAMLSNPDPADWINWRRTQDAWGYSPLKQINTTNVRQLQLAWSWALGDGISQPTPLVHDGLMYLPSPNGLVQALDAITGELLWQFKRGLVVAGDWDRNLYIHDAATADVLFQTRLSSAVQGYPITYAVNDRQYIAVPVGAGSALFNMPKQIFPDRNPPPPGNALYVFALPEKTGSVAPVPHSDDDLNSNSRSAMRTSVSGPGGQQ